MHVTGPRDGPPMLPGAIIADMAGAMQLALGVVTALLARERHGIAQKVNNSSYGAQIWLQAWEIQQAAVTGNALKRDGAHHPNLPGMYGIYGTADGEALFIAFHMTEESWQSFCNFAGMPEIGADERWNAVTKRMGMGGDAEGKMAAPDPSLHDARHRLENDGRMGRVPRFRAGHHLQPRLRPSGRARRPAGAGKRLHPGDRRRHDRLHQGGRAHRHAQRDAGLHQGLAAPTRASTPRRSCWSSATTGTRSCGSTSTPGRCCGRSSSIWAWSRPSSVLLARPSVRRVGLRYSRPSPCAGAR